MKPISPPYPAPVGAVKGPSIERTINPGNKFIKSDCTFNLKSISFL